MLKNTKGFNKGYELLEQDHQSTKFLKNKDFKALPLYKKIE